MSMVTLRNQGLTVRRSGSDWDGEGGLMAIGWTMVGGKGGNGPAPGAEHDGLDVWALRSERRQLKKGMEAFTYLGRWPIEAVKTW